jgi:hypothetical protein
MRHSGILLKFSVTYGEGENARTVTVQAFIECKVSHISMSPNGTIESANLAFKSLWVKSRDFFRAILPSTEELRPFLSRVGKDSQGRICFNKGPSSNPKESLAIKITSELATQNAAMFYHATALNSFLCKKFYAVVGDMMNLCSDTIFSTTTNVNWEVEKLVLANVVAGDTQQDFAPSNVSFSFTENPGIIRVNISKPQARHVGTYIAMRPVPSPFAGLMNSFDSLESLKGDLDNVSRLVSKTMTDIESLLGVKPWLLKTSLECTEKFIQDCKDQPKRIRKLINWIIKKEGSFYCESKRATDAVAFVPIVNPWQYLHKQLYATFGLRHNMDLYGDSDSSGDEKITVVEKAGLLKELLYLCAELWPASSKSVIESLNGDYGLLDDKKQHRTAVAVPTANLGIK